MNDQQINPNNRRPLEELDPELRRIVEAIIQETPSDTLTQRVLQTVRGRTATDQAGQPRPVELRQKRRATPRYYAAATAIIVTACAATLLTVALFVPNSRTPEGGSPTQTPVCQDLPTAWAYHKAIAESPEAIDALLTRHAKQVLRPEPTLLQARPSLFSL